MCDIGVRVFIANLGIVNDWVIRLVLSLLSKNQSHKASETKNISNHPDRIDLGF